MINTEHKKYGSILIIEPSDKDHRLLKFGKNRKGVETMLSYTAGFARLYTVDLIIYRDIEKDHINIKRGPAKYTSEFKEFILDYGSDFQPIESRFDILDL
jgi:hypothetical protein